MRRVYSVSRYWPPILSPRSSTATSRRSSRHESSWTTRGCRLIGTSSGGPSASPEASALFSQRIVRLNLVPFSLFILARLPENTLHLHHANDSQPGHAHGLEDHKRGGDDVGGEHGVLQA